MDSYHHLFEQQSYQDALDCYLKSIQSPDVPMWDDVILTAGNHAQARAYEEQLAYRKRQGLLPARTRFAVIPDPDGQRIGSGGATFSCIRYAAERAGDTQEASDGISDVISEGSSDGIPDVISEGVSDGTSDGFPYGTAPSVYERFEGRRILVIHSGGASRRAPQYSVCGKLFSPVPRLLPDGSRSTLFDEMMIGMSMVAGRIDAGMLVCSGDVLLLFNALQIDFYGPGAAALSIRESVETGKNHGVYLGDEDGNVGRFLHKHPPKP